MRKVSRLHQWDVLRANKAPFAFGIEPRVPFLDKQFLEVCMNLDPQLKMVRPAALLWDNLLPKPSLGLASLPRSHLVGWKMQNNATASSFFGKSPPRGFGIIWLNRPEFIRHAL